MNEKPLREIFPFRCNNKECEQKYTLSPPEMPNSALEQYYGVVARNYKSNADQILKYAVECKKDTRYINGLRKLSEDIGKISDDLVSAWKNLAENFDALAKERFLKEPPLTEFTFENVVQLWGFICLRSSEHLYFGFTCPKCRKTSINKYNWEQVKIELAFEVFSHLRENPGMRYVCIPFSISSLLKMEWIEPPKKALEPLSSNNGDCAEVLNFSYYNLFNGFSPANPFYAPQSETIEEPPPGPIEEPEPGLVDEIQRGPIDEPQLGLVDELQPGLVEEPQSGPVLMPDPLPPCIKTQHMDTLLDIENREQSDGKCYRVFPRFVYENSIYVRLAKLDKDFSNADDFYETIKEVIKEILRRNKALKEGNKELQLFENTTLYRTLLQDKKPNKLFEDRMTIKDYETLIRGKINKNELLKFAPKLHKEYRKKRNWVDFELTYKNELINPYAKRLFGKKRKDNKRPEHDKKLLFEAARTFEKEHPKMTAKEILDRALGILKKDGKSLWTTNKEGTYQRWIGDMFSLRKGRRSVKRAKNPIPETEPKPPAEDPAPQVDDVHNMREDQK